MTTACKAAGITKKIIFEIYGGNPADEIINLSNLIHFDLIVMGSRRIASMIEGLGSTTRKVAATSKVPLLYMQKQPSTRMNGNLVDSLKLCYESSQALVILPTKAHQLIESINSPCYRIVFHFYRIFD